MSLCGHFNVLININYSTTTFFMSNTPKLYLFSFFHQIGIIKQAKIFLKGSKVKAQGSKAETQDAKVETASLKFRNIKLLYYNQTKLKTRLILIFNVQISHTLNN